MNMYPGRRGNDRLNVVKKIQETTFINPLQRTSLPHCISYSILYLELTVSLTLSCIWTLRYLLLYLVSLPHCISYSVLYLGYLLYL